VGAVERGWGWGDNESLGAKQVQVVLPGMFQSVERDMLTC